MLDINQLYKLSWLTSGEFDGESIEIDLFRQTLHKIAIILSCLECVKALILVFATNKNLRWYLIEMHMTEDGTMIQTLFNSGAVIIHFSMLFNHFFFYRFTYQPERISFLKYLFINDLNKFSLIYEIKKKYVEKIFKNKIFFKYFSLGSSWCYIVFLESLILRCTYKAYFKLNDTFSFIFISIPFSITLFTAFWYSSFSALATYITFIANCNFLTLRFENMTDQLLDIFKEPISKKKIYNQINSVIRQTNLIIKFFESSQYLANRSISFFSLATLLIQLFFPYMMIFENNSFVFKLVLFTVYLQTMLSAWVSVCEANSRLINHVSIKKK